MSYLQSFGESWGLIPTGNAVAFLDNHDTQRNGQAMLTYKNGDLYKFANIFMLAWPYGNIKLMSSYYFTNTDQGPPSVGVSGGSHCGDGVNWVCEHRWKEVANMVKFRKAAGSLPVSNWQNGNDANKIAFSRGDKAFLAMNRGSSEWSATLKSGLAPGSYCNVLASIDNDKPSSCSAYTVDSNGLVSIKVPPLGAVALHVLAMK
jgi:alpha-amylase